ncbi:hypothetical protein PLUTO_00820 [Luteibacter phage vB_LflM-Pluto]|uniref:Uncharacterized protein n=1 Tax=Luteibacter phage vB_LflM-Pluto TaxID=2948611 RepID=A0A9E7MTG9_9CAUD|nr:hypothetical protein PLUTO_00820 [Luteibacter phage vB_LflM-Pluto]
MSKLQFKVEQIAIAPPSSERAIALLEKLGLTEWYRDHVVASGEVGGSPGNNEADLAFNYQTDRNFIGGSPKNAGCTTPLEFEVLEYTNGDFWTVAFEPSVSHLGMHVTHEQLAEFRAFFESEDIGVAQEVTTSSHTNPAIADSRRYNYVIFATREILGVDLKFIVRLNVDGTPFDRINPSIA